MSRYTVFVTPAAIKEIKRLPGYVRQRVRRAIGSLADEPRPTKSKVLEVSGIPAEVGRLRLDRWRILYAITEADAAVDVLGVRKRPPYEYQDLRRLLGDDPSE